MNKSHIDSGKEFDFGKIVQIMPSIGTFILTSFIIKSLI